MGATTFTANKDARIVLGSYDAGNGLGTRLDVGYWSGYRNRSLIGFNYSFTGWTGINSATLTLKVPSSYSNVGPGSRRLIYVRRLTSSWSEGSQGGESFSTSNAVRWGNQPGNTATNQVSFTTPAAGGTANIDITSLMRDALASGVFYGLLLFAGDESGSTQDSSEFLSKDYSGGSYKPTIAVNYATNNAPYAPTGLWPSGSALVNSITPVLSGSFSDPDAGDYMTGAEVEVWNDGLNYGIWGSGMLGAGGASFSIGCPALTGNTYYQWRGRTKDAAGAVGAWSGFQRFKVNSVPNAPWLSISGSAGDETTLTPVFYVTHNDPDPSDSQMYGYRIICVRSWDGAWMWDTGNAGWGPGATLGITYAGTGLSWGTQYYFIAQTLDSNGAWSQFSGGYYFTTHQSSPPGYLSPDGSNVASSLTPTLSGQRTNGNDSLSNYEIEVYEADGVTLKWQPGASTSGMTSTSFSRVYAGPALTGTATYKWRARITSSVGGLSAWSAMATFIAPDPNAPTQTTPVGTGITPLTPTMTFTRGVNFNRHQLYVYANAAGSDQLFADTPTAYTATGSKSVTYAGTALQWNTTYYWKVRVSADGGTTWSPWAGNVAFTTDAASIPTLTLPADGSWETTLTPTFTGSTQNAETITVFRILLYAEDQTTLVWDSTDLAGAGTTFSKVYNGPALVKGRKYFWKARYTKSTGAVGNYSPFRPFHINADPQAPTNRTPVSGAVVADSLTPAFKATFADDDISAWGDTPTLYEVEVRRNSDDVLMHSLSKNTGLVAGENSVTRAAEGSALSYEVEYKWRTRYTDSKSAAGSWSNYSVFRPSQSPTLTLVAPSVGSNLGSPTFLVDWTMSSPGGKAQGKYRVRIIRQSDAVVMWDTGIVTGSQQDTTVPAGYLTNLNAYTIEVSAWDTDGLATNVVSQTNNANWTAPDPPANFNVVTDDVTSFVMLSWNATALGGGASGFVKYTIYRRVAGDATWTTLTSIGSESTVAFNDYYAAVGVTYDYRITVWKKVPGDVNLESSDSDILSALLDADTWYVVGNDRSEAHSFALPVTDNPYSEPVQQESFEPLGRNRKTIVRGKPLGAEGTIKMTYLDTERAVAIRQIEYLRLNAGPHILKSPFGEVWEVEFSGPQKTPRAVGHLDIALTWTEVV